MRNLNRNKRPVWYALQVGEKKNFDEFGNETGEPTPVYGEATEFMCNVSAASGEDAVQAFGSFSNYTRTMCISDLNCPIDEKSVVWFGTKPPSPHNYIVTRKADSKNGILYALREVTVA